MNVYLHLHKIILGSFAGEAELGYFTNSYYMSNMMTGFIVTLGTVMMPRMSNLTAGGQHETKARLMGISMKYIMMLAFAMAFGMASIAHDFAPLYFGMEFAGIGWLVVGLCVTKPFTSVQNIISTQHLLPNGQDKPYTVAVMVGVIVSIITALLFIPKMGAMGAVAARVASEVILCVAVLWFVRRQLPIWQLLKNNLFFLPFGAVMFAITWVLGSVLTPGWASLIVRVIIGATFYLTACAVYLYITRDEFFMRNVVQRLQRKG
jgi:O-antigen/teichoic acid export membrane protein